MIYLDTHVVLWLYADRGKRLSERARRLIEDANVIRLSPMVMLEMDFLHEIGRTTLPSNSVYEYLRERIGIEVCNKPFIDVIKVASQQTWTRDPFDRVITGHAALNQNPLITKDEVIRNHYKHTQRVRAEYTISTI